MDALQFMRDHQAYFEDYVTRSTYHSNAIEGSTLSFAETYAILWNDNTMKVTATARELYEAINHKYALATASENMDDPLSERLVKAIARDINRNISGIDDYRHGQVIIRGAEHLPPAANQVNQLMMQLVYEYNHDEGGDPFLREARFHVRFERVHPFEDGNGRIARLLVNFVLHRYGYPMIVIHSEDKSNYLNILHQCDVEAGLTPSDGANATLNDILPFVNYLSSCLIRSLTLAIKAAKGESIEEEGDFDKKIAMLQRRYSDKAIEKSSRSVEQARSAFFELAVYVEQKISGLQKLFDRTFITNTPTWNMARKINTPNPDEPIIQSHILYTKSKEYSFVEDIIRLSKKSQVDYFKLKYDAVTFHFNHCRYAGDNTFDFPFCIYIQYLSDGNKL